MESDTRGIGEVARASGLSVSALRFYDGAGVLVPAVVDRATGYRRYTGEQIRAARLIAGLRRVGMPVAEIAQVVSDLSDPARVRHRLDLHLARLEAGLADARRELLRLHTLIDLEENLMTRIILPAADLTSALDAVRFAAPSGPGPIPAGLLFETTDGLLTLVATDRYRLAVASVPAETQGQPARQFLPLAFCDELRAFRSGPVTLDLHTDGVRAEHGGRVLEEKPIALDFPDYRRLLAPAGPVTRQVTVSTEHLRAQLAGTPVIDREHDGSAYPVTVLDLNAAGELRPISEDEWKSGGDTHIAVNREFLLQALDAGGSGQLLLELDGPVHPLAIRVPGDETRFSLLMPVRA
ncbi:MerR family transcriptional regulator [Actinoplanes sp. NBRC 101535]|uniref:DNA polymerase III subunit beta family protein n=1 Tax=Actinoplanes sp. NBRC 101535 TaxID=3032196 RepID=UPI0005F292E3|nr:MerR family transcriptional regulator [Actinoplanes sp. NBRC 101535]GLY01018.1 hypothetical protein Acsp01_13970 [Actinoplanes sp. NBRC 101535]